MCARREVPAAKIIFDFPPRRTRRRAAVDASRAGGHNCCIWHAGTGGPCSAKPGGVGRRVDVAFEWYGVDRWVPHAIRQLGGGCVCFGVFFCVVSWAASCVAGPVDASYRRYSCSDRLVGSGSVLAGWGFIRAAGDRDSATAPRFIVLTAKVQLGCTRIVSNSSRSAADCRHTTNNVCVKKKRVVSFSLFLGRRRPFHFGMRGPREFVMLLHAGENLISA